MRVLSARSWGLVTVTAVAAMVALAAEGGPTAGAGTDPAPEATAASTSQVHRLAGADRFATAAELARRAAGDDTDRVWLATGADYPDALAASASGDPVVLVTRDRVPAPAAAALADIAPHQVVAAGGEAAVGDEVVATAAQWSETATARAGGDDRFATAAAVADHTHPDSADTAWLATGFGFADALAAGAVAAAEDAPLLLAAAEELPDATRTALERLQPDELVVAGGTRAVPGITADTAALAAGGAQVTRLAGDGRFATAAAIAQRARQRHGRDDPVHLATGFAFPDALAAGPAAAAAGGPLLLAATDELTEPTRQALVDLAPTTTYVVGGQRALSAAVAEHAADPTATPVVEGVCDRYDATEAGVIQGHPEGQRPQHDAWTGPWMVDHFRQGWQLAVPYRWRFDVVDADGHGGVLFYEDSESGAQGAYTHSFRLMVVCGNPFVVAGGQELDPNDPDQIAALGPHGGGRGAPDVERRGQGPAIYSAEFHDLGNANPADDHVERFDYVAVGGDVLMLYYEAENRFARAHDGEAGDLADAVTGSVGAYGEVGCPAHASQCRTDRDRTQGGTPP